MLAFLLALRVYQFYECDYVSNLGYFSSVPVRSGHFGMGRFGSISMVSRRWVISAPVSKVGHFSLIHLFGENR